MPLLSPKFLAAPNCLTVVGGILNPYNYSLLCIVPFLGNMMDLGLSQAIGG